MAVVLFLKYSEVENNVKLLFYFPPTQCCGSSAQRTTSTPAALSRCWSGGWRTPLTRLRTKCWRPTVNWLWRYNVASRTLFIGHNEGSQVCHICTLHANQANVNYKCQEFGSVRPRGRCVIALINTKTTVDEGGNGRTEWGARWKKVSAAASHLYILWASFFFLCHKGPDLAFIVLSFLLIWYLFPTPALRLSRYSSSLPHIDAASIAIVISRSQQARGRCTGPIYNSSSEILTLIQECDGNSWSLISSATLLWWLRRTTSRVAPRVLL